MGISSESERLHHFITIGQGRKIVDIIVDVDSIQALRGQCEPRDAAMLVALSEQPEQRSLAQWAFYIRDNGYSEIRGVGEIYAQRIFELVSVGYPVFDKSKSVRR